MGRHRWTIAGLLLAVAAFTFVLGTLHVHRFNYDPRDEAVNNQILHNTAHGRIGFNTIKGDAYFHRHFRPIFLPLAIPYMFVSGPPTYYFTSAFVLALGAIFAFLLGRHLFDDERYAFLAGLAWLLFAPVHELALNNFDPETIAATFWLGAFYFFQKRDLRWFWVLAMLGVCCKETHAPILAAFGVLALIERRDWRWIAPPILVGAVWFVVTVTWLIPAYTPEFKMVYNRFAGVQSPDFWGDITRSVFADPSGWLAEIFRPEDGYLFGKLLLATLGLALLGPLALLPAGTIILQILLHKDALPVRQTHMLAGFVPFLFAAMLIGIKRVADWLPQRRFVTAALLTAVMAWNVAAAFLPGPFGPSRTYGREDGLYPTTLFSRDFYRRDSAKGWLVIDAVPDDAAVIANSRLLLPLSSRAVLREFDSHDDLESALAEVDWIALTFSEPRCLTCTFAKLKPQSLRHLAERLRAGHFVVVVLTDQEMLLRRLGPEDDATPGQIHQDAAHLLEAEASRIERESGD